MSPNKKNNARFMFREKERTVAEIAEAAFRCERKDGGIITLSFGNFLDKLSEEDKEQLFKDHGFRVVVHRGARYLRVAEFDLWRLNRFFKINPLWFPSTHSRGLEEVSIKLDVLEYLHRNGSSAVIKRKVYYTPVSTGMGCFREDDVHRKNPRRDALPVLSAQRPTRHFIEYDICIEPYHTEHCDLTDHILLEHGELRYENA